MRPTSFSCYQLSATQGVGSKSCRQRQQTLYSMFIMDKHVYLAHCYISCELVDLHCSGSSRTLPVTLDKVIWSVLGGQHGGHNTLHPDTASLDVLTAVYCDSAQSTKVLHQMCSGSGMCSGQTQQSS